MYMLNLKSYQWRPIIYDESVPTCPGGRAYACTIIVGSSVVVFGGTAGWQVRHGALLGSSSDVPVRLPKNA